MTGPLAVVAFYAGTARLGRSMIGKAKGFRPCNLPAVLPVIAPVVTARCARVTVKAGRAGVRFFCTRARDDLIVTGVEPTSEFLDDLTDRS